MCHWWSACSAVAVICHDLDLLATSSGRISGAERACSIQAATSCMVTILHAQPLLSSHCTHNIIYLVLNRLKQAYTNGWSFQAPAVQVLLLMRNVSYRETLPYMLLNFITLKGIFAINYMLIFTW